MARYNYFMPKAFGGKDLRESSDPLSSAVVCDNFRFSDRMGLRSRCGFSKLATLPVVIRGLTSVTLGGRQFLIAAAGDTLYSISDGAVELGRLARNEGDVLFFIYGEELVIFDGDAGFVFDSESLKPLTPYLPMAAICGINGNEYQRVEPPNCLTDLVRIRFSGTVEKTEQYLLPGVCDIVSVTRPDTQEADGWRMGSDSIIFDAGMPQNGTYEAVCRTNESVAAYYERKKLYSARFAEVFGRVSYSRIYLFASSERGRVYYSRKADPSYSSSGDSPFYFCADSFFTIGQGDEEVRGTCRFLDRMFIFTENSAWFVSNEEVAEAYPLHSNAGCAVSGGAFPLDNNPVTVGRDGIYLWDHVSGYSECSADFACPEISAELTANMIKALRAVGVCRARSELWLCPDTAHGGGAIIWEYRRGIFYRFCGFKVNFMTEYGSDVVFSDGKLVYGFSETADDDDGRPIVAVWENSYGRFSNYPSHLRLHRAAFTVYPDGGEVSLTAITDNGRSVTVTDGGVISAANDQSVPLTFEKRAKSGDFHRGKFRLTSSGGRSEIVSAALGLEIKKSKK